MQPCVWLSRPCSPQKSVFPQLRAVTRAQSLFPARARALSTCRRATSLAGKRCTSSLFRSRGRRGGALPSPEANWKQKPPPPPPLEVRPRMPWRAACRLLPGRPTLKEQRRPERSCGRAAAWTQRAPSGLDPPSPPHPALRKAATFFVHRLPPHTHTLPSPAPQPGLAFGWVALWVGLLGSERGQVAGFSSASAQAVAASPRRVVRRFQGASLGRPSLPRPPPLFYFPSREQKPRNPRSERLPFLAGRRVGEPQPNARPLRNPDSRGRRDGFPHPTPEKRVRLCPSLVSQSRGLGLERDGWRRRSKWKGGRKPQGRRPSRQKSLPGAG